MEKLANGLAADNAAFNGISGPYELPIAAVGVAGTAAIGYRAHTDAGSLVLLW